mmetsp:Transcript_122576/g.354248  ORF Transcript_122576/g.354248 Transcript_122576/m.354248 type:complete len:327 (-) Transcript_122576:330-1310(-)
MNQAAGGSSDRAGGTSTPNERAKRSILKRASSAVTSRSNSYVESKARNFPRLESSRSIFPRTCMLRSTPKKFQVSLAKSWRFQPSVCPISSESSVWPKSLMYHRPSTRTMESSTMRPCTKPASSRQSNPCKTSRVMSTTLARDIMPSSRKVPSYVGVTMKVVSIKMSSSNAGRMAGVGRPSKADASVLRARTSRIVRKSSVSMMSMATCWLESAARSAIYKSALLSRRTTCRILPNWFRNSFSASSGAMTRSSVPVSPTVAKTFGRSSSRTVRSSLTLSFHVVVTTVSASASAAGGARTLTFSILLGADRRGAASLKPSLAEGDVP